MIDLSETIIAKSDQLNAEDLIGGMKIIKIISVKVTPSSQQPVVIHYENENGRPYKPSKGMRKILISAWGTNGENYIGRSIELYNDPTVLWAGVEYGGIRISRLSHIKKELLISITERRGHKTARKIGIIIDESIKLNELTAEQFLYFETKFKNCENYADLQIITTEIKEAKFDDAGRNKLMSLHSTAKDRIIDNAKL